MHDVYKGANCTPGFVGEVTTSARDAFFRVAPTHYVIQE